MKTRTNDKKQGEEGQVLVWMVFLMPLLMALVGFVYDGGMLWIQYRKAQFAMDSAAVAAGSVIDVQQFVDTGQVELGDDALLVADWYARQNYHDMSVTNVYVSDNVIYLDGTFHAEPVFLGVFGANGFDIAIHGKERPQWGISEENQ